MINRTEIFIWLNKDIQVAFSEPFGTDSVAFWEHHARRLLVKHAFSSAPLPDVNCLRFAAPAEATWRPGCSEACRLSGPFI